MHELRFLADRGGQELLILGFTDVICLAAVATAVARKPTHAVLLMRMKEWRSYLYVVQKPDEDDACICIQVGFVVSESQNRVHTTTTFDFVNGSAIAWY